MPADTTLVSIIALYKHLLAGWMPKHLKYNA